MALRKGRCLISGRIRKTGRAIVTVKDALDRALQVELGIDDPREQALGATERPTREMPSHYVADLLGRLHSAPPPRPNGAVRGTLDIRRPKGPPALPFPLSRRNNEG